MFIETAQAAGVIDDAPTFAQVLRNAFDFLLSISLVVALIGFVLSGMMYFFANGDRKRISAAKKISVACVLGSVVLAGTLVILRTIASFFG